MYSMPLPTKEVFIRPETLSGESVCGFRVKNEGIFSFMDYGLEEEGQCYDKTVLLQSFRSLLFPFLIQILENRDFHQHPEIGILDFGKREPQPGRQVEDGPSAGPGPLAVFRVPGDVKEV